MHTTSGLCGVLAFFFLFLIFILFLKSLIFRLFYQKKANAAKNNKNYSD